MEEDIGIKGTVTRLRRRLSVESDDVKSPSAPSTPTKKRGGRLAAKPQLELIDENVTENVPKKSTRKSVAKEVAELLDEKPVTPSRRSARIKSNSSIISETTQAIDSPRAKRAARRTSQVGSDNEAPVTPARQTRRVRKDSTSSLEKQVANLPAEKISTHVAEVISEEPETVSKETNDTNKDDKSSHTTSIARKSPRLKKPNDKNNDSNPDNDGNQMRNDKILNTSNANDNTTPEKTVQDTKFANLSSLDIKDKALSKRSSMSTSNLLNELNNDKKELKVLKIVLNKTDSAIEVAQSKRHRTNSWTTISVAPTNNNNSHSDSETSKNRNKIKDKSFNLNKLGGGDGLLDNISKEGTIGMESEKEEILKQKNTKEQSKTGSKESIPSLNKSEDLNKSSTKHDICIENNKENILHGKSQDEPDSSGIAMLLEKLPAKDMQPLVYIEDSDSNTGSIGKPSMVTHCDGEDQCVPVVVHSSSSKVLDNNFSYEPMEIDETIPENVTITDFNDKNNSSNEDNKGPNLKQGFLCLSSVQTNKDASETSKKCDIESSVSHNIESQNLETNSNENKSTLLLSQIKHVSSNEINSMSKSPKENSNKTLSKSINIPDVGNGKDDKQNLSVNYSTSTPLQQKPIGKLKMQMNTSNITPNKGEKAELKEKKYIPKKEVSKISKSSDTSGSSEDDEHSEENSFKKKSDIIDDEAEEASNNYESGDSRDDEEIQYEKENEIVHKGETLDSEEDYTDDTDYEKDSFVVSSDEEDNDLLSGSGDDLSMSDNELTMSAKSKKKYNDRKSKEQTKASKEMFNSRHKLNDSGKNSKLANPKPNKSMPQRFDSSDSEDENTVKIKKNNYHRILDSSKDNSDIDESIGRKKHKSKRLSESLCEDSAANEKEITICNNSILEKPDPLTVAIKLEPKTPHKDLNISTVHFTGREEVEKMDIDENVSVMRLNETSDPLQATIQYDDSSTSSDHLEIIENYDSVLNNLNSENEKQIKSLDISLNLNKKTKQKMSEPIIDQLNLTQTKKSKKVKNKSKEENTQELQKSQEIEKAADININENENEGSSDSIDMRLLFPEDSNDSEANGDKSKQANKDTNSPVEDFIPLKSTVAKTNIPGTLDMNASTDDSLLNVSKKKNKKRTLSQFSPEENLSTDKQQESNVNFFIDTKGSLFGLDTSVNATLISSTKKIISSDSKDLEAEHTPFEIECHSEKKKKTNKNNKSLEVEETPVEILYHRQNENNNSISDNKDLDVDETPLETECQSGKKKKNKKINISDNNDLDIEETPVETECHSEKKKKNKKISISDNKDLDMEETPVETEYHSEKKKKNKKNSISETKNLEVEETPVETECHSEKKKKNKKNSISDNKDLDMEETPVETECHSEKKKKNKKISISDNTDLDMEETPVETECHSEKKKKNKKYSISETKNLDLEEAPVMTERHIEKKTKKSKHTHDNNSEAQTENIDIDQDNDVCFFIDTTGAQLDLDTSVNTTTKNNTTNKKKKNKPNCFSNVDLSAPPEITEHSFKKKSKQVLDGAQNKLNISGDESDEAPIEMAYRSEKYNKSDSAFDTAQNNDAVSDGITENSANASVTTNSSEKKKNKKKKKTLSQSLSLSTDKVVHVEANHNTSMDGAMKQNHKIVSEVPVMNAPNIVQRDQDEGVRSKNRKRKSSADPPIENTVEGLQNHIHDEQNNKQQNRAKKSKKNKKINTQGNKQHIEEETDNQNANKKRKEREDDNSGKKSKILKENSFDKIHVPRLPAFILNQLEAKPKKEFMESKKSKAISTTQFVVETTKKRKNKPSNYLEESIYLNDSPVGNKQKGSLRKPKVLPFIPTASTSESGFTSDFRINVIPQEVQFIAQSTHETHFKNDYLQGKRIRKLGTLERYKKHRNMKISKF